MAKNRRIKTYKKIYMEPSGPFSSPLGVVIMTLGLVVAAVVGWSAYAPIRDFVMNIGEIPSASSRPHVTSNDPAGSQPEEISQEGTGASNAQEPAQQPKEEAPAAVSAVYMPAQYATDASRVDAFINALPGGVYNTVIVDLKDAEGKIYYKSNVAIAVESRAVAATGMDAAALAGRIRDAGYTPAARIHAFSDRTITRTNRDAAVKYINTDWIWLDNSQELGGNPWLNPYSDIAQNYVINIAGELARAGFKLIVVDSVHFPTGVGLDKAGYGAAELKTPRAEQLHLFSVKLSGVVEAAGGRCAFYVPMSAVLDAHELVYGKNPAEIYGGLIAVGVMPQAIQPGIILGDIILSDPMSDPSRTVSLLLGVLPVEARSRTIVWLQGYDATGAAAGPAFVAAQLQGIPKESQGYVLYNPQGTYKK